MLFLKRGREEMLLALQFYCHMKLFGASIEKYNVVLSNDTGYEAYPYLRAEGKVDAMMYLVSPLHGRSYLVGQRDKRYIISKGNGLSYSDFLFLNTLEMGADSWGLLLKQDSIRDFVVGNEVRKLGVKTNSMEYVLELQRTIEFSNGLQLKPALLQYSVECPYRISDAAFMSKSQIEEWVLRWDSMCDKRYASYYLMAAEVLICNLKVLHSNGILHNAISIQNYTWALELLDFELAHSPAFPKTSEDAKRHIPILFSREIIHTYEIIVYIAGCLGEEVNFCKISEMFQYYGYDLAEYKATFIE